MATFSVFVFCGNTIIQLLILKHLKDIFHVDFVGFLWTLLRLIKSNPVQQLFWQEEEISRRVIKTKLTQDTKIWAHDDPQQAQNLRCTEYCLLPVYFGAELALAMWGS